MKIYPLSQANLSFKVLVTFFLLTIAVGYLFGIIHIFNDTGFSFTGVVTHYRGDTKELTIPPEFAFEKLIHQHHVHIFALSMLFILIGSIFCLTRLPEKVKVVFVAMPFVGMILDFTSFWLLVFASPLFAWFGIVFGAFMGFSFFLIIGRPLYEMWILPIWDRLWEEGKIPWFLR